MAVCGCLRRRRRCVLVTVAFFEGSRATAPGGPLAVDVASPSFGRGLYTKQLSARRAAAVSALLLIMEQQPAASNCPRSRELMRLPAQSRSVSRSRSRSPVSQHPDDGDSDEEFRVTYRRSRADEARVEVVLAKMYRPADGHDYNWGLPAFDGTKTLLGYYHVRVDDGAIAFAPAWVFPNLLPADVALARYAYDREMKERSDAVHSLFQYDSVENLRRAAHRYYFSNEKPVLPGPRPSIQNPAHLIYLVPEADFPSLMDLLDNINDEYFQLDTPLQLRQLAVAAGDDRPHGMGPSRLFKLVDAVYASFEPRKIQEEVLLLDDGEHLPIEALPAFALLRVHAEVFQDITLCCDMPLYLLSYHGNTDGRFMVVLHDRIRFVSHRSHLLVMIELIKKSNFRVRFRRYLHHYGSEFMNFLRTFIQVVEQVADGHAPLFTFQIHKDFAPTSSGIVEREPSGAGSYFVHRKHVGALGALLQDVWQLHRSKFYMGGLLPDASIDWRSPPPSRPLATSARLLRQLRISRMISAPRPADVAAPVAAIAPGLPAPSSDADSS